MKKATIAYILIAIAGVGVIAYVFTLLRKKSVPELPPEPWSADDEATLEKMKKTVEAEDPGKDMRWIMPLVRERIKSGELPHHTMNGRMTKSGAFLSILEAVNPNANGKFTGTQSGGGKQIYSDAMITKVWNLFADFKYRNETL